MDPSTLATQGTAHIRAGRDADALPLLRELVRLNPADPVAHNNLGVALERLGQAGAAERAFRAAIALDPGVAAYHLHLGNALRLAGRLDAALAAYRRAVGLAPADPRPFNGMAAVFEQRGMAEAMLANLAAAAERAPESAAAASDVLVAMHYLDRVTPEQLFRAHLEWAGRFAGAGKVGTSGEQKHGRDAPSHGNGPETPGHEQAWRRLRVGYVSPDFRQHPTARFFEPVLEHHDRTRVEVFCYSDCRRPDAVTERLRGMADGWREIAGLDDAAVEHLIRGDRIDLLIDLAGHMANPRLTLFARRPAPVQVTWLGYPNTTGMSQVDWRITDEIADPPGATEHLHAERLMRVPSPAWCYRPIADAPAVGPLPAEVNGFVTFGCTNRPVKVGKRIAAAWATILNTLPTARLVIRAPDRTALAALFGGTNMPLDRVDLIPRASTDRAALERYNAIDIALDTFPYHGTATTCDSLWMGVPVITLAGQTHASRVGASLLDAAGLGELVATTPADYVRIATELAGDLDRLAPLRRGLRERVSASPLADGAALARKLEGAYRAAWADWCARSCPRAPNVP